MFEQNSRYESIKKAVYKAPDGREITYVRRRFLPQGTHIPLLVEVTVTEKDRLDLIASNTLGDPELFWQICDANNAMNPFDLTDEPGRVIKISAPQYVGTP